MADDRTRRRSSGLRQPEVRLLVSMFAAAVVMSAIAALAVWVTGGLPPRYFLVQPTWQWTGSAGAEGSSPLVVADPARYTIDFAGDRTFAATADCNQATGTYGILPAGRAGGAANRLMLEIGPVTQAACEPGSLSDAFLAQLAEAAFYRIEGSTLTITLADGAAMAFEAASGSPAP